jgi:hypothetical protein
MFEKSRSSFKPDHNLSFRIFTITFCFNLRMIPQFNMNDSALIGGHRFQGLLSPGADNLIGNPPG